MENNETKIQKVKPDDIQCYEGFECWKFEDSDILVSFPDKNLLIPTNKKTVLGAFLKEFSDNLEYRNRVGKIANIAPTPYFIALAVTSIMAIGFLVILYYAYSKNMILFDPFISLFGFFASLGLVLTCIGGIFNWNRNSEENY